MMVKFKQDGHYCWTYAYKVGLDSDGIFRIYRTDDYVTNIFKGKIVEATPDKALLRRSK